MNLDQITFPDPVLIGEDKNGKVIFNPDPLSFQKGYKAHGVELLGFYESIRTGNKRGYFRSDKSKFDMWGPNLRVFLSLLYYECLSDEEIFRCLQSEKKTKIKHVPHLVSQIRNRVGTAVDIKRIQSHRAFYIGELSLELRWIGNTHSRKFDIANKIAINSLTGVGRYNEGEDILLTPLEKRIIMNIINEENSNEEIKYPSQISERLRKKGIPLRYNRDKGFHLKSP